MNRDLAGITSPALLGGTLWCTGDTWGAAGDRTLPGKGRMGAGERPCSSGSSSSSSSLVQIFIFHSLPCAALMPPEGSSAPATIPGRDISPHY